MENVIKLMYCSLVFNTLTIVIFFIYGCNIDGWTALIEKKKYVEQIYIFVSKKKYGNT